MTSSETEQKVLKQSIGISGAFASSGILLGLLSGSQSIVFDGLFSVIDTLVLMLALTAARLVQREGDRRFQYGYWHIEPMVLAFNGSVLMFLCLYAFINAVGGFLAGGHEPELDWPSAMPPPRVSSPSACISTNAGRIGGSGRICYASTPRVG